MQILTNRLCPKHPVSLQKAVCLKRFRDPQSVATLCSSSDAPTTPDSRQTTRPGRGSSASSDSALRRALQLSVALPMRPIRPTVARRHANRRCEIKRLSSSTDFYIESQPAHKPQPTSWQRILCLKRLRTPQSVATLCSSSDAPKTPNSYQTPRQTTLRNQTTKIVC